MAALFLAEEGFHVLLCGAEFTQFGVRAVVAAVIAALSAAPPGTEHWEYVCRKCGTHFELSLIHIWMRVILP